MKPKVFVASSVENLSAAYCVQVNLERLAEVTVWNQGVFELSHTTIESLIKVLDQADFGVFVFGPDDVTTIRHTTHETVRDNVILEFGMFVGALGRDHCFIILPDGVGRLHLPTDLLGLSMGTYQIDRSDGNLQAALGPACNKIELAIQNHVNSPSTKSAQDKPVVYLGAPHKNVRRNHEARKTLESYGIEVNVPEDLVKKRVSGGHVSGGVIRSICIGAIRQSSAVVVDLDTYGLDTAWEIGFAEGLEKPVIGFSRDQKTIIDRRFVNLRHHRDNFMHGWDESGFSESLDDIAGRCSGRSVHVCGTFSVSSGDGGNPSPSGEEKVVVVWSRAEVPTRRAHKVRSEGALGVDTEVSKESIARAIGDSCARPDPTDRDRARAAHHFGQSGTRPRPRIFVVSPASGYQHDRTVVERDQLTSASSGVSPPAEAVLGPTFLGTGVPGGQLRRPHG